MIQLRDNGEDPLALADDMIGVLYQLRLSKVVFDRLAAEPPQLPVQDSPLPELLAIRSTSQTASETRSTITSVQADADSARRQLASENARLHAYELLATALEERLDNLKTLSKTRATQTPVEVLQSQISDQGVQQQHYVQEGDLILRKLTTFINDNLAPMIAAEDLGGPPIGDLIEVSDEALGAGFTAKGKTKQSKSSGAENFDALAELGQQRREAASKEIRKLIRRLLRTFDDDTAAYIKLERESASSRYLVQASIAELHPHDALQMRLLEFTEDNLT